MKRFSNFILILLAIFILIPSAVVNAAESIKLSGKNIVEIGKTIELTVTTSPKNSDVKWYPGNKAIATVNKNGVVTGVKTGKTTIKACLAQNTKVCATKEITVYPALTLSWPDGRNVRVLDTLKIVATTKPKDLAVTWTSPDKKIFTVTSKGVVQGVTANKSGYLKACLTKYPAVCHSVKINVLPKDSGSGGTSPTPTPVVTGVTITGSSTVEVKQTIQLKAQTTPDKVSGFTWSSDNTKVATVNDSGVVTGVMPGVAKIKACSEKTGICSTYTVTVKAAEPEATPTPVIPTVEVSGVRKVAEGKKITLTAELSNNSDPGFTWESKTPSIATVDDKGVVTGVKEGEVNIKVCTATGTYSCAKYKIWVIEAATSLTLTDDDDGSRTIDIGTKGTGSGEKLTYKLKAATDKAAPLTWSSSDESVATVDSNGIVTGKKPGTAKITVKTTDGTNLSKSITITVVSNAQANLTTITIDVPDKGYYEVLEGKQLTLKAKVTSKQQYPPEDTAIIWTSMIPDIATVSSKGVVTGVLANSRKASIDAGNDQLVKIRACLESAPSICANGASKGVLVKVIPIVKKITVKDKLGTPTIDTSVNAQHEMEATVTPAIATQKVTWSSSDTSIATVSSTGLVTGKAAGKVTITATATDGSNVKGSIEIEVKSSVDPNLTTIEITGKSTVLENGKITLKAVVTSKQDPAPDSTKVEWKSKIPDIATVSDTGVVTGVLANSRDASIASGTKQQVYIWACLKKDPTICANKKITVIPLVETITVKDKLGTPTIDISTQPQHKMEATVTPAIATQKVTWSSSDTSIATVSTTGLVTAKTAGKVKITATATDGTGKSGSITITVTASNKATAVTVSEADGFTPSFKGYIDLGVKDKTYKLKAEVAPAGALQKVTWSSSNVSVATVSDKGVVKGLAEGKVTITAAATDGSGKKGTIKITVTYLPHEGSLEVNGSTSSIKVGETTKFTASFDQDPLPTNKKVTWLSKNPAVATVDDSGVVTGVSAGSAYIKACSALVKSICATKKITVVAKSSASSVSSTSSTYSASAVDSVSVLSIKSTAANTAPKDESPVSVPASAESISFNEGEAGTAAVGEEFTLHANNAPADLLWVSSDETIAAVDQAGVVTPLKEGTAMLAAATTGENGEMVMQSYMLTVSAAPAAVKADAAEPETAVAEQTSVDTVVSADTMIAPLAAAASETAAEEQPAEAVKPSFVTPAVTLKQAESAILEVNNPQGEAVMVGIYGDTDKVLWDEANRVITGVFPGEVTAYIVSMDTYETLDYMVVTVADTPELAAVQTEEQQEVPAAEPAEVPYVEPEAELIPAEAEEPTVPVTEEPAAESEAEPVAETVEEPAPAIAAEPAAIPAEEPVAETVVKPEDLILPEFKEKEGAVTVGDRFELAVLYKEDEVEEYDEFEVIFEQNPEAVSWNKDEGIVTAAAAADVKIILKAGEPAEKFAEFLLHINPRPTEVPTAMPTEVPTEVPTEAPTAVPTDAPVEQPVEAPVEQPVEQPAEQTVAEPVEQPVEEPVESIAVESAEQPVEEPVEEITEETAEEPVEETPEEIVEEPVEEAAEEAVEETAAEPAAEVVEEPVEQTAEEAAVQE